MSQGQKYPILDSIASMIDKNEILETDIPIYIKRMKDEKLLQRFPKGIFDKYIELVETMGPRLGCTYTWQNELVISVPALQKACKEIEADLCVMLARRKDLVGKDEKTEYAKLAKGKIAGITTFRLSRAPIIQLSRTCLSCKNPPCRGNIATFNTAFAIKCGLHFINKPYNLIPKEIGMELLYTLTSRHTNQETLGIIFDTFKKFL